MLTAHHDGSPLYVSDAAPALGDAVRVRLRIPASQPTPLEVLVRSNPDREPFFNRAVAIGEEDGWAWWEAEITIANPVHRYRWLIHHHAGRTDWLNQAGLSRIETRDTEDFAIVTGDGPPAWATTGVLYQVFPDRFARSAAADTHPTPSWAIAAAWDDPVIGSGPGVGTQLYGGDLAGVEQHLDHIQSLGATIVYLTPVFPARSNHRYDASTFDVVDPLLGGDDALVSLVEAAHARGLKVLGDLTTNHSGDGHEWFQAAFRTPEAAESAFYYFLDEANETYASWLGHASLPKLDWSSDELRRRFIDGPDSIVARYLQPPFHLDGWRIDVANMTGRLGADDFNAEVRRTIRRTMEAVKADTLLLGESTNDATDDFQGDAWHGAMTYADFTRPVWGWLSEPGAAAFGGLGMARSVIPTYSGVDVHAQAVRFTAGVPWRTRLHTMNALDTHDTPRFLTNALPGTAPVALGMAVALPGIPVVWAGDELGLTGVSGEDSRTPMPWSSIADHESSISMYRELLGLRAAHPVLATGGMRWLHIADEVLVWVRESRDECVLVVAARGVVDVELDSCTVAAGETPVRLHGDATITTRADGGLRLTGTGPSFTAFLLPGVRVPEVDAAERTAEQLALDVNAGQDAALAAGVQGAASTETAAWGHELPPAGS